MRADEVRRAAEMVRADPDSRWEAIADLLDDLADGDDEGIINPLAITAANAIIGEH